MKYLVTYDTIWDSKIEKIFGLIEEEIKFFLSSKNYSEEITELRNVIMCNNAVNFGFKKRSKFSRKEKYIYFDVYVHYDEYMEMDFENKKAFIANSFINNIELLSKYKPIRFDLDHLKNDFILFFTNVGWLPS